MSDQIDDEMMSAEIMEDGTVIVRGDIDIAGSPLLEVTMEKQESTGAPLVLDLENVYFIDSAGLRSLLAASRRAQENQRTIALRSVGREVHRLLEITGTTELFDIQSRRD